MVAVRQKTSTARKTHKSTRSSGRTWPARVTMTSDAMTLESHLFTKPASAIAQSIKHSAERSNRCKSPPFRSAMSMLTFYENRVGENLSAAERKKIDTARRELQKLFNKSV